MDTIVERPAALDVHKAQVTACVRVPNDRDDCEERIAEFPTTVRGLLGLRDWLAGHDVDQVVMEATGAYWKAPWAILEDEFECLPVNARHVKQAPGRKTDVSDAAWLCRLAEAGLLKASFVPPKPIRQLRNLTRYRKTQIQERSREVNRGEPWRGRWWPPRSRAGSGCARPLIPGGRCSHVTINWAASSVRHERDRQHWSHGRHRAPRRPRAACHRLPRHGRDALRSRPRAT